jgi:enoyl-CoA hydratase
MTRTETTVTSKVTVDAMHPGVRVEREGASVRITLNRPDKLNAIDSSIREAISREIPSIARDPQVYAVFLRAAPARVFSAGGDIRELYHFANSDPTRAAAACASEYALIWLLDNFSKPTVAWMDGAVMGTAAGIMLCMTHRVAGPGFAFQMPETAIGFFPDNGVAWHLSRLPHEIGTWLGLTGASIGPADALHLGLLTHVIAPDHYEQAAAAIADCYPVDQVLDAIHIDPGPRELSRLYEVIERCFSATDVREIMRRLDGEKDHQEWCQTQLATLASRPPLALAATLEHIRRAHHLDLRQTLAIDYRLAVRMSAGHDFREAVRTRLIDRSGQQPLWRPSAWSDLSPRDVQRLFQPLDEGELALPCRQEMQARRV